MKNDPKPCSFNIYCPDSLLWWLLIICLMGAIITGSILYQISNFMTDKEGKPVSLIRLQLATNVQSVTRYLSNINIKGLNMVRKNLLVDFAFMPFLYLLMVSISCLSQRHLVDGKWNDLISSLCIVPFAIWLVDVIENIFTLSVITDFIDENSSIKKGQTNMMFVSSAIKWVTGILWFLCMMSYLIAYLVTIPSE